MKHHLIAAAIFGLSAGAAHAVTFSGTAEGSWVNPIGTSGFTINNNDAGGTADVNWGTPFNTIFDSLWSFDGVGSDGVPGWTAQAGDLFKVGDFIYVNGSVIDQDFKGASLAVTLFITNPLTVTQSFSFVFDVINTPNTSGDPVTDGDIASIANTVTSATFTYDGLDYTLELLGFSADEGATLTTVFNSPEGSISGAALYGRIVESNVVPVPASLPLLLGALGGLGLVRRARRRAA